MEEGFTSRIVDNPNAEPFKVVQIPRHIIQIHEGRRLLPYVTEAAGRIAAVSDVIIAEDRLHEQGLRSHLKVRPESHPRCSITLG